MDDNIFSISDLVYYIISYADPLSIITLSRVNKHIKSIALNFRPRRFNILCKCAYEGYYRLYKYFNINNTRYRNHINTAIKHSYIDFLKEINYIFTINDFNLAVRYGHLKLAEYILDNNYIDEIQLLFNSKMIDCAVISGNVDMLKYIIGVDYYIEKDLFKNGARYCNLAIKYNNLSMLIYLREEIGCRWNYTAFHIALYESNIGMLNYLHKNRCSWEKCICSYRNFNNGIYTWCKERGYEFYNSMWFDK